MCRPTTRCKIFGSAREIVLISGRDLRRGLILARSYNLHDEGTLHDAVALHEAGALAYVYAPTAISEKSPTLQRQLLHVVSGCS